MDIEQFYAEDERRRASEEIEYGRGWTDSGGSRYALSWVEDTGELYVMREPIGGVWEDPFGDVFQVQVGVEAVTVGVLGVVTDRAEVERALDGWQAEMGRPGSITWVVGRLHDAGIRKRPGDGAG